MDRTSGFHPLFSKNTRHTPLGQSIAPLSLCPPGSSQQKMFKDTDTFPSAFPLAPRAFLAPVRVRELTGNQHSQGSSSFCLFETCHFLISSAHFSWGTISPPSPFPFLLWFYQLLLHFPSFSSSPARALSKLWTTLLLFSQSFFHSALSSLGSGRGWENLHKQFQAQQIYRGLLVLCFVSLFLP